MEDKVIVDGLTFVPYITSEEIRQQVERIAAELRKDLQGKGRTSSACSTEPSFSPPTSLGKRG